MDRTQMTVERIIADNDAACYRTLWALVRNVMLNHDVPAWALRMLIDARPDCGSTCTERCSTSGCAEDVAIGGPGASSQSILVG